MKTVVVWIMVMHGYGSNLVTGPEFSTQEKCDVAAELIKQSIDGKILIGGVRKPMCVRIEK